MQEQVLTEEQQKLVADALATFDPKKNEEEVTKAIEEEKLARQKRLDKYMGLEEDDPEEFKTAVRAMGPLTRKLFMKKIAKGTLTEARYQEYLAHYNGKGKKDVASA